MPYRKQQFLNNEIYHAMLRGIDDNPIFKDVDDYYRGIFSIYEFNTSKPVTIQYRRKVRVRLKKEAAYRIDRGRASNVSNIDEREIGGDPSSADDERDKLVEILAFCFMPNHIHLLLRQIKSNGITKFMSKVGTGYGGYFNRKRERKGYVFQNRFSAIPIRDDDQLKTVFVYIHTNPISLKEPWWKEKGIKEPKKVIAFLENYKWSSYLDYILKKNFPSVTERNFISKVIGGKQNCKEFIDYWVKHKGEIKKFPEISLEA